MFGPMHRRAVLVQPGHRRWRRPFRDFQCRRKRHVAQALGTVREIGTAARTHARAPSALCHVVELSIEAGLLSTKRHLRAPRAKVPPDACASWGAEFSR